MSKKNKQSKQSRTPAGSQLTQPQSAAGSVNQQQSQNQRKDAQNTF